MATLVAFTNTGPSGNGFSIGNYDGTNWARAAGSFTPNAAWSVDGATIVLQRVSGTNSIPLTVRVETNTAGLPSGTLADANATGTIASTTDGTLQTYTVSFTPFNLTNGVKYWLVCKATTESGEVTPQRYRNKYGANGSAGEEDSYDSATGLWTSASLSFTNEFSITGTTGGGSTSHNLTLLGAGS